MRTEPPSLADALCRRFAGGPIGSTCVRCSVLADITTRDWRAAPTAAGEDYFFFRAAVFRLVFFAVFFAAGFVFALAFFTILPS